MKIYITRHGETKWNKERRMQGSKNSDLTEKGIDNAKKLGVSLSGIDFAYIYTSPLGRAFDTANYVRSDKSVPILTDAALQEMNFGVWEGMSYEEIEEIYAEENYNFWNAPERYKTIEGESFEELIERVNKVLHSIIENSTGENILIVTHTAVIKAIYSIVLQRNLDSFWNPPYIYDTCLTILEIKDGKVEIVLEADITHLSELKA